MPPNERTNDSEAKNQNSLSLALFEPEIPGNAGNIARLCAATGTALHLIGRLGFSFRHPDARRAGMDYWKQVEIHRHIEVADFLATVGRRRVLALTTRATRTLWEVEFGPDDVLLLGPESRGLPPGLLEDLEAVRIPMLSSARSLNIATAAGVALYEALRQTSDSDAII